MSATLVVPKGETRGVHPGRDRDLVVTVVSGQVGYAAGREVRPYDGRLAAGASLEVDGDLSFFGDVGSVLSIDPRSDQLGAASAAAAASGGAAITVPFVASGARNKDDIVSQGGQLYTAVSTGTNPAAWDGTGFQLGAPKGWAVAEANAGALVADWLGNGLGVAATLIAPRLTQGLLNFRQGYSPAANYSPGDSVIGASGITYFNVSPCTGVDPDVNVNPAAGYGTKWARFSLQGPQGNTGLTGSPTGDQSILLRHFADLARDPTLMTGHIAQAMDRRLPTSNVALTALGQLQLTAVAVPGGRAINHISLESGSIGATSPTHQWFSLYDANRNKLAVTNDDTTNAWAASSLKTLDLTAPYTPPSGALLYVGCVVTGTTAPNLSGMGQSNPSAQAPLLGGSSSAGLTDPASAPAAAAALVAKAPFWASLS